MLAVFRKTCTKARAALAGVSMMALAACDPSLVTNALPGGGAAGQSVDPGEAVPVALLLPTSDSNGGPVARSMENAVRLAVADLAGKASIDLRVYDTEGSAAVAGQKAQAAVDAGAKIIIGPLFAEAANAAGRAVADDDVVVLALSNNASIAGGNVFVMSTTFENTANRLMSYAARQGKSSAVILHQKNLGGEVGRNAFTAAASRNGMSIVDTVSYDFNPAAATAAGTRANAAMQSTGADTLLITAEAAGSLGLVAGTLDASAGQSIGLTNWDNSQVLSLPSLQGGWFATPDRGRLNTFESRYSARYGSPAHPLSPAAYDAMAAVGTLLAGGRRDALTTRALTRSNGFEGAAGIFRLRSGGTVERGLAVARVANGSMVVIDPAPRSFGGS
ncbi:penicillin-binding protein activator [Pseudaestuariivita sp.]|uniref:penicillin-binding protein activator n=1 Tax=Pseudaestuariivita sp. TaxID=2211669 RepID=UPI004058DA73